MAHPFGNAGRIRLSSIGAPTEPLILGMFIALTALSADAHSSVSLFGLLAISESPSKGPGGQSKTALDHEKWTLSYARLNNKEGLGGATSAAFRLERPSTGAPEHFGGGPAFSRTASVGRSRNSLGTPTLSHHSKPLLAPLLFKAFGDSPSTRHQITSDTTTKDTTMSDA